jgi:hypothetical protein
MAEHMTISKCGLICQIKRGAASVGIGDTVSKLNVVPVSGDERKGSLIAMLPVKEPC